MANTHLLKIACTVAMLAAAPAFAQSNTEVGSTGAGGTAVNPTAHEAMPKPSSSSMSGGRMHMGEHSGHHHMMGNGGGMHDKMSHETSADKLNDQSYQAAHSGQPFTASGMMAPSSSGSMNDMSGGSMSKGGSDAGGGAMSNSGSGSNGSK